MRRFYAATHIVRGASAETLRGSATQVFTKSSRCAPPATTNPNSRTPLHALLREAEGSLRRSSRSALQPTRSATGDTCPDAEASELPRETSSDPDWLLLLAVRSATTAHTQTCIARDRPPNPGKPEHLKTPAQNRLYPADPRTVALEPNSISAEHPTSKSVSTRCRNSQDGGLSDPEIRVADLWCIEEEDGLDAAGPRGNACRLPHWLLAGERGRRSTSANCDTPRCPVTTTIRVAFPQLTPSGRQ